jgi:hypothetical protein
VASSIGCGGSWPVAYDALDQQLDELLARGGAALLGHATPGRASGMTHPTHLRSNEARPWI